MSSPSGFLLNMLANKTLSFRDNTTTQTDIISKNNSLPIQYRTANQKKKKTCRKPRNKAINLSKVILKQPRNLF
jgi:hypothetical protein